MLLPPGLSSWFPRVIPKTLGANVRDLPVILAENATAVGAIQIAGTARPSPIATFIASCDYVLIGEEMYAATAYLTKQPVMPGTLVAQDW